MSVVTLEQSCYSKSPHYCELLTFYAVVIYSWSLFARTVEQLGRGLFLSELGVCPYPFN